MCDANLGQKSDNYACFYEGTTNEPFWHTPFPYKDGIDTGPVLATTRLLVSYDYAVTRHLSFGTRLGYAFRGGPPAGQTPQSPFDSETNLNNLPAHAKGEGGTPFLPAHVELRAYGMGYSARQAAERLRRCRASAWRRWTPRPPSRSATAPKHSPRIGILRTARSSSAAPEVRSFNWEALPETPIDAWKKTGQGFVALSLGGMLKLVGETGLLLNVNAMYMFPAAGIVLEPSLGVVTGLP